MSKALTKRTLVTSNEVPEAHGEGNEQIAVTANASTTLTFVVNVVADGITDNQAEIVGGDLVAQKLKMAMSFSNTGTIFIGNANTDDTLTGLISNPISMLTSTPNPPGGPSGQIVTKFDGTLAATMPWQFGRRIRFNLNPMPTFWVSGASFVVTGQDNFGNPIQEVVYVPNANGGVSVDTWSHFAKVDALVFDPALSTKCQVTVGVFGSNIVFTSSIVLVNGQLLKPDIANGVRLQFNGEIQAPINAQIFDVLSEFNNHSIAGPVYLPRQKEVYVDWFGPEVLSIFNDGDYTDNDAIQVAVYAISQSANMFIDGGGTVILPSGRINNFNVVNVLQSGVRIIGQGIERSFWMTLEAKAINVTQPRHLIPAVASPIFQNAFCGVFGRSLVCMDIPPATYGLIPYPNPLNGLQEFVARLVFQPNFEYFSGSIPLTHPANSILHSTLFCSNGSGGVVDNPAQPLQANKAFTIVLGTPSPVAEAPITACVTFSQYPCWTPGKSYTKGSIVTPRFPNGYIYQATANFISGPNEPGYYDIPEDKNIPDSLDIIHAWSENIGETVPNDSNTLESWVNIGFDVIDVKKVVSDAVISDRGGPYEVELNYTGGILYLFVTDFSDGKTYLSQQSVGANQPLFQGWYESLLIGGEPPQGDSILLAQNENAPGVFSGYIDSVQFSTVATNHTSLQTYSKPTQPYSGGCFLMNWNRWTAGGCMYAPEAGQVVTGGQQYSCRGNETSSPPYITSYTANFHFELAYLKIFNYGVDVFNTLMIYVHDLEQSFGPLKLRCCYDSEVKNIVITGGFAVFCGLYVGYNANLTISNVAVNGGNMAYYIGSPCDVRSTVCESQYRFGLIANIDGNYGSLTVSRVSIGNESQLGWHYTSLMGVIGVSTVQGDIVLDQHLTGSTHPIFNFSALVDGGGIASNINLQLGYAIIPTSASPDFWFDLNNPPYFSNFNISSLRLDLTTHGGSMNDNRMSRVNGVGRPYTITTAGVVTGFNTISTDSLRTQASDATVFTAFYPGSGQGRLTIFDVNGYGFGLANSSTASQATYQILTQNGADLVGLKSAELIYDPVSSIWRVLNTYPLPGSGAAPTVVSVDTINLWDAAGGQTVHITGTNFITNATFAKIGEGANAQYVSVSVSSSTTGTFITSANMSGNGGAIGTSAALDLTIITNNGSATLNSAVWYLPAGISNYYRADQGLSGTTWVDQVSTGGINAVLNKPAVINANYAGSSLPSLSTAGGTIHATIALPPVLQPFTLAAVASSTSTATRSLLFDSLDQCVK